MKFYIVDAFAEEIFGGNPAGVVILEEGTDFPTEEIMIKTAAELRYSETAFIKQVSAKAFNVRYFTPVEEVDLCGHATIGSFGALLDAGTIYKGQIYELITKAGKLEVELDAEMNEATVFMDMGKAAELNPVKDVEELARVLGIKTEDIGFEPKLVSTGLPDIMLHIKTKEALMRMKPDFDALSKLSEKLKVVGVHAFALSEEPGIRAYCRNFAPLYGINEEAATGTSNGALTYYLYKQNIIKKGDTSTFLQGESMGRPSKILTILDCDNPKKIKVGGTYKILAKGALFI
ncbi:MAG: PhzF family phenazine biosynthesis protein [Peptostreptococcaceae bacterium]|nr:PhzF family phenazine biosynthesis protein [Peptostreptococcaceae bacterium]